MRIGVDMDGVMCDFVSEAVRILNASFKLTVDACGGNPPTWDYIKGQVGAERWDFFWEKLVPAGVFRRLRPYNGAFESVSRLARKHDVVFLTTRPRSARTDTLLWLVREMPCEARGVVCFDEGESKAVVPCDVYVDDRPKNCEQIRRDRPNALVVMKTMRYNLETPWAPRCASLQDFEEIVRVHEIGLDSKETWR